MLLDGALLGLAGIWSDNFGLLGLGLLFAVGALLVWLYWQRYQRQLTELNQALQARFLELQQLKQTLEESAGEDQSPDL